MAKKTNYISYELKKFEKYFKQITGYLDANPPDKMVDRVEYIDLPRGGTAIKVIASKETQIKCWTDRFKELPPILEALNRLRKAADGEDEDKKVRGDQSLPGFMQIDDEDDNNIIIEETKRKEDDGFEDDDDEILTTDTDLKQLPPASGDLLEDEEDYWQGED